MRGKFSLTVALLTVAVMSAGCHQCLNGGPGDPHCACQGRIAYNLPPADRLMEPGPGVGGPGPGVIPPVDPNMGMGGMGGMYDGAVMPASYMAGGPGGPGGFGGGPCGGPCGPGGGDGGGYGFGTSQIAFLGEDGLMVSWDVSCPGSFDSGPLTTPGRQDFPQGSIYRLRLSNLPSRDSGIELFPTLEVAPATPRTDAFLAHSPIPVQFTEEDFDQVLSGNFVTKVIYLPDPEFQEVALSGVETLVSTRLDPGVDPIAEADRRGSILAILRIGNKDLRTAGRGGYGPGYGPGPDGCAPGCYGMKTRKTGKRVVPASYETGMPTEMEGSPFDANEGTMSGPVEGETNYGPVDMGPQSYESAEGEPYGDEGCGPTCNNGGCYGGPGYGDGSYGGPGYGDGGYGGPGAGYGGPGVGSYGSDPGAQMPLGMPTAGFAPPSVPPQMIAGGPTWGMPITGTPIGLPGPPHIPLGVPAGLQKHEIKNRTREYYPPPVTKMTMSVKQRPGNNYPNPVNHVTVDEVHREPGGLFSGLFHHGMFHHDDQGCGSNCPPGGPDASCPPPGF